MDLVYRAIFTRMCSQPSPLQYHHIRLIPRFPNMKKRYFLPIICACFITACQSDTESTVQQPKHHYTTGKLPEQTPQLIAAEWEIYRKKHPEMPEAEAKKQFDIIQTMSAQNYQADVAIWADRRALGNAWVKNRIHDVYHPDTVPNDMIQAAADAYAFSSGHPALVTVSHILIKPNQKTTAAQRKAALEAVRQDLLQNNTLTDEALSKAAIRLIRAGYRVDVNKDLKFPRHPMTSFMGEQLFYQNTVEPFADASFKLSPDNKLSPVTESEFGYHLILFKNKSEEKKADVQKDRDFLLSNIVSQGRKIATQQYLQELMHAKTIRVDELRLQEITQKQKKQTDEQH